MIIPLKLWKEISPKQKEIQNSIKTYRWVCLDDSGWIAVMRTGGAAIGIGWSSQMRSFSSTLSFDSQKQLAASESEAWELKPGVILPEVPSAPGGRYWRCSGCGRRQHHCQSIVPGSPAAAQKDLHVGDRIIAVCPGHGAGRPGSWREGGPSNCF